MVNNLPPAAQHGSGIVDTLLHPLAVRLRQLLDGAQEEGSPHSILIDDEENILRALGARVRIERVFHTGDKPISETLQRALTPRATVHEIAKRTSKKLFANDKLSRVFAVAEAPKTLELAEFAVHNQGIKKDVKKDIVVLENLGISGNIGATIRTAVAFGVGGVVLLDSDMDIYDRRLIRASRGHVFSLPMVKATTPELLAFCEQNTWQLLVANPHASHSHPVDTIAALPQRLAIVFGNEKGGCSKALLEAARFQIKIPLSPTVESLNVSAAAAITLFQRFGSNCPAH